MNVVKGFLRDDSGATAVEYGLLVALISISIVAAVKTLSGNLQTTFSTASDGLANAGK